MKKLLVVLAILFIGILLAGCTSQPAKPVATPAPTTVATPEPTTVAPTPTPTKVVVVVIENKTPVVNVTATPAPTAVPEYKITFTQDLTIVPGTTLYVPVGSKVTWVNADPYKPHSVMATDASDGAWFGGQTTAQIPSGQSFSVTFAKAGTFEYTTGPFQPQKDGIIYVK
ncbi:hypothetical protein [uncultured Methanoregula sp.]|uniref:cupredoxin domain-containing protein n=1 Tax=uncultured Methanoregula sp. TaxID=1005933 RepID=UPI002AAB7ABF|nr:hypothetical protein [uncultured Methanoregula sp.]